MMALFIFLMLVVLVVCVICGREWVIIAEETWWIIIKAWPGVVEEATQTCTSCCPVHCALCPVPT